MSTEFSACSSVGKPVMRLRGRESDWRPARKLWNYTEAGSGLSRRKEADLPFASQSQTDVVHQAQSRPWRKKRNKREAPQRKRRVPRLSKPNGTRASGTPGFGERHKVPA